MTATLRLLFVACLLVLFPTAESTAQGYPSRSITIVVPFAAGGATDVVARLVSDRLAVRLGQSFVIENKAGANGAVGTASVAKAEPDGYTLVMGGVNTHAMNDGVMKRPLSNSATDFAPVGLVAEIPIAIVVHNSLGVSTLPELIALAKAKPGTITYGSSGTGGPHHLAMELFKDIAKLDLPHVPYRGGAPQLNDLVGGHIKVGVIGLPPVLPHLNSGVLRALAVVEGKRSDLLPAVPTIAEQGYPGFAVTYWMGLLAPAKTPKDVIERLARELAVVLDEPELARAFKQQGASVLRGSPDEFKKLIDAEIPRWGQVAKTIGAKLEE